MKFLFPVLDFPDLVVIQLQSHPDDRGKFTEVYHQGHFATNNVPTTYYQDNESHSKKGVLRGLHFQKDPYGQGKLVRVSKGCVQDVVVDLRSDSPSFKKHFSIILDETNMMYVPPGFAHGFYALEDSIFHYKCTTPYNKDADCGIIWNDPELNIEWQIPAGEVPLVSTKDQNLKTMREILAC